MTYVVKPGDTLYLIAQRFGTTVNAILRLNPQITNPDLIFPWQEIRIPVAPEDTGVGACPRLRMGDRGPKVRRFQELLRISGFDPGPSDGIFGPRTHRALLSLQKSVKEIEITGVADRETWRALGAFCEPDPQVPPGPIQYTVRPGDSLYIIGLRFNVSVSMLMEANPQIEDEDLIMVGQIITIPR